MTDPIKTAVTDVKAAVDSAEDSAEKTVNTDVATAKADVAEAQGFFKRQQLAIEIGAGLLIVALLIAHFV
jgi:hypothetical protein